jgi:cytosine/adenosine deaminase-related metal-dependent hydrolase
MLAATGTTTVADIEAVPELLPEVWSSTPLRVFSFMEMTNVRSRRPADQILEEVSVKLKSLRHPRNQGGLSPHAPYSTSPDLLRRTAELARASQWRVTMHLAESIEEFEMCRHRRGSMFDWLKNQRDMSDCGHDTPVGQIRRVGLLAPNFLAVHANYLDSGDVAALAESGASVVHCPRSHHYFRHAPFPYEQLAAAGVNVCLGTDSLASTTGRARQIKLDMFAEMHQFALDHPSIAPDTLLQLATSGGARALGLEGQLGGLFENALADLIAIPYEGGAKDAAAAVTHYTGPLSAVMMDGEWQNKIGI